MAARRAAIRVGGICGILYVVFLLPAYFVGFPSKVQEGSGVQDLISYFATEQDTYQTFNGVFFLFSAFFFVWFLGILYSALRSAEGEGGISPVALAGGIIYVALAGAAVAVEVSYPATLARFVSFEEDVQLILLSLSLSSWLYHFCQIGTALLASATSLVVLESGVLPRWLGLIGIVVALLALLHFLFPLLGSLVGPLWVLVISTLMLATPVDRNMDEAALRSR